MSKFTKELIDNYADKLLISLTEEENKGVLEKFDDIDIHIAKLNDIDGLSDVEPMTHCLDDFEFELRDDEAIPSIPIEDALRNSEKVDGREIEVVKVVG